MVNPVGNGNESVEANIASELEDDIVALEEDEEEKSLDWMLVDKPTEQQPNGPLEEENRNGGERHATSVEALQSSIESETSHFEIVDYDNNDTRASLTAASGSCFKDFVDDTVDILEKGK